MKILLIDTIAAFLDFALRCDAEGHEIRWYNSPLPDGTRSRVGDGLVTKINDWQPSMRWADIIITSDNARYVTALEPYRKRGFPIFGCHSIGADWELKRDVGQSILEAHGIPCLPSIRFDNYDKAIEYVTANASKRFVAKPLGDAPKDLSYVSKSSQDLVFMLQHWKKHQTKRYPFILQEFTPGIEMAVGGWVGRNGFASYFLENFEFKKLMNGEVGCNTGEMGTAMKYCKLEDSLLAQQLLLPLEAELIRNGYTGYIDVAVIIDDKGTPWPLEFTCRPGWPLFQIQQVLHPEPVEWMRDALSGADTFTPYTDIALGIVVAMPQFPYHKPSRNGCCDFPVWGVTTKNRYWLHPCDMQLGCAPVLRGGKLVEEPLLVTAGPYVMVVTGAGPTVSTASEAAYDHLKSFEVPNSPMYRTDIGCRLEAQLPKLHIHGYATSWDYS